MKRALKQSEFRQLNRICNQDRIKNADLALNCLKEDGYEVV
jgi:hypothetical protein